MINRLRLWTSATAITCLAALLTSAVVRADDDAPTTAPSDSGNMFGGKPAPANPPAATTRPAVSSGPLNFPQLVRFQHTLAAMTLSDAQQQQATTILEDANQKITDAFKDGGRRARRQIYYIVGDCRQQLAKLLTPDQADQFNQALGPPPGSGGGYGRGGRGGPPSGGDDNGPPDPNN